MTYSVTQIELRSGKLFSLSFVQLKENILLHFQMLALKKKLLYISSLSSILTN